MVSVSYEKFTLSNGLEVVLHEDHTLPVVAVNVWYHVGSKNEEPGKTGFAHLFEHLMFEGSKHHNRSHFEPLQKVGATLNGSTTADRTNYWENVPSNYLELALWLEADRMGFLLDALDQKRFDIQREVVKNERRQNYENRPYGMASMLLQPQVFPSPHPYHWLTIGTPEDLDAATLEDAKAFFRRFYGPSNASLAIVGDFDSDQVKRLVEQYFGDIPPGPHINRMGRMDSPLRGQVRLVMHDRVQLPRLYLAWPTVPAFSKEQAPLDILAMLLGDGKSSRLYRLLVYEKQMARDLRVMHYAQEVSGEFHIQVTANPGYSLQEVQSLLEAELERIKREPPTEREMLRAKNRIESNHIHQLERLGGFGGRADILNYYNVFTRDPGAINTDIDRYLAVSGEDVQRAAALALGSNFVRLSVMPERPLRAQATGIDRTVMPTGQPARAFRLPVPRRARLANGLSVMVVEKPDLPLVAFGILLDSGAVADPLERPGLAHMTASMLLEGTTTRTSQQIAEEMEFMGAHLISEASREYVLVSTETLTSQWSAALAIMADVVRDPTFPPEEIERLRKERLTDLRRIHDNPTNIAMRASRALLYGPQSRYGHPVTGIVESIEAMTQEELVAHFRGHYCPENATLLVVGDVTMDEAISRAEELLGDWRSYDGQPAASEARPEGVPLTPTTIYLADKPGSAQSVIRAGHLIIPRLHPDYYATSLLNYVFGGQFSSRLNMNLRQARGYSYGYFSSIDWFRGPSALLVGGAVQTNVTRESVAETLKEFADIRGQRPVTEEEFRAARDGILRGLPSHFETQVQVLHQLCQLAVFGLPETYFAEFPDRLQEVGLEDVRRAAREVVHDDQLKVLVVGDRQAIEPGLRDLGLPIVPVDYEGRELP